MFDSLLLCCEPTEEFTEQEFRLVGIAVNHALKGLDWIVRGYLCDDARQEASLKLFLLRPTLADIAAAERERYAMASLCHALHRWVEHELKRWSEVESRTENHGDDGPADEKEVDWNDLVSGDLLEAIGDEGLARELGGLQIKDQQLLNLHFFHQLTYEQIAGLLHESTGGVKKAGARAMRRLRMRLESNTVRPRA
jgi:DNA-directed RNA polymerase specialized sigma24 family protein